MGRILMWAASRLNRSVASASSSASAEDGEIPPITAETGAAVSPNRRLSSTAEAPNPAERRLEGESVAWSTPASCEWGRPTRANPTRSMTCALQTPCRPSQRFSVFAVAEAAENPRTGWNLKRPPINTASAASAASKWEAILSASTNAPRPERILQENAPTWSSLRIFQGLTSMLKLSFQLPANSRSDACPQQAKYSSASLSLPSRPAVSMLLRPSSNAAWLEISSADEISRAVAEPDAPAPNRTTDHWVFERFLHAWT